MPKHVVVPDGCKAVIVTDQLLDHFKDWAVVGGPDKLIEARVEPTDDPYVVDVMVRQTARV